MASPEAALIAVLNADAGVLALVEARVFIAGGRQGEGYPYVTVQRISTGGAAFLDGASNLDWPRFQVDCWGTEALSVLNAGAAVRSAIDGKTTTGAGLTVFASFQDQRGPAPDEETRNFRVSQDYLVFHERT